MLSYVVTFDKRQRNNDNYVEFTRNSDRLDTPMPTTRRKQRRDIVRSEVFGLRLDPRLKYIADIAARKQRRSIANYIEFALENALRQTPMDPANPNRNAYDEGLALWDIDEVERFIRLAEHHPDLLSYEEQLLWKEMCTNVHLISLRKPGKKPEYEALRVDPARYPRVIKHRVRRCWAQLKEFSEGSITRDELDRAIIQSLATDPQP